MVDKWPIIQRNWKKREMRLVASTASMLEEYHRRNEEPNLFLIKHREARKLRNYYY